MGSRRPAGGLREPPGGPAGHRQTAPAVNRGINRGRKLRRPGYAPGRPHRPVVGADRWQAFGTEDDARLTPYHDGRVEFPLRWTGERTIKPTLREA